MSPPIFPHKCLAFHGPMLYEAKTIKIWDPVEKTVRTKASENSTDGYATKGDIPNDLPPELETKIAFYIHYKGWKSTWDEWVSEDRVLTWNEENLRTQKELKQMALAAASKKRHGAASSVAISVVTDGHHHLPGNMSSSSGSSGSGVGSSKDYANGSLHDDRGSEGSTRKRDGSYKDDGSHPGRTFKRARGGDPDFEKDDGYIRKPEVSLNVPDQLKSILVDDWEFITKEHQVVPLPRDITVSDVLEMYRAKNAPKKQKSSSSSSSATASSSSTNSASHSSNSSSNATFQSSESDVFDEIVSGIKIYFDRALGSILLYRFERQQYLTIRKEFPDKLLCDIYGPEHLLRLFVSFPALIAQTNMDQQSITVLREHLEDLLKFMMENRNELFLKEYGNTSPQYEAVSRAF